MVLYVTEDDAGFKPGTIKHRLTAKWPEAQVDPSCAFDSLINDDRQITKNYRKKQILMSCMISAVPQEVIAIAA
jgi:hypothetical protein